MFKASNLEIAYLINQNVEIKLLYNEYKKVAVTYLTLQLLILVLTSLIIEQHHCES